MDFILDLGRDPGVGNGNPLQYSCLGKSHGQYKRGKKDMRPEYELPRLEGVQYATGERQRIITNSSRKNEMDRPKQKQCSAVDTSGGESKVQCCKEQHCIEC